MEKKTPPNHLHDLYNVHGMKCSDSFQIVRTVLKHSDSFQIVRTVFKPFEQFSNRLASFQTVWTVSNRPDSFQTVWTIVNRSRQCWKSYHLNINWRIFNYWSCLDVIQTNKAKLGFLEWLFVSYAQKLSGRAKSFQVAMLPCYRGFCASAVISCLTVFKR